MGSVDAKMNLNSNEVATITVLEVIVICDNHFACPIHKNQIVFVIEIFEDENLQVTHLTMKTAKYMSLKSFYILLPIHQ